MDPRERYNELLSQKLIKEFDKHNIEGHYYATKEEALKAILGLLPKDAFISSGSSVSLDDLGLREALDQGGYNYVNPKSGPAGSLVSKLAHEALDADYFLMSANAIAVTGELVNIDGNGNRVAALIFGPKHVMVIAGMNKVELSLDAAIERAKGKASYTTALAFNQDYADFDTLVEAAQLAQGHLVVTRRVLVRGRTIVILVGEDIGY